MPAAVIVLLVTALLVIGIRESANTNTLLVVIKSVVLVIFVAAGIAYVRRENLTPFIPPNTGEFGHFGWSGVLRGSAVMFFAYIGFDAVSTAAQEAKNPQRDMPFGILVSLALCTVLYIAVAIVLIGIVPYTKLNVADPIAVGHRGDRPDVVQPRRQSQRAVRSLQHDARAAAWADAHLLLDEPRWAVAAAVRPCPSAIPYAAPQHDPDGRRRRRGRRSAATHDA